MAQKTLAILTADRVIADLRRGFGDDLGDVTITHLQDAGTRYSFSLEFELYGEPMIFNLDDRGFFGFSLLRGAQAESVLGSSETGSLFDFPPIVAELERRLRAQKTSGDGVEA